MRVGIDASNLRGGGGVTHLVELLAAADPEAEGIARVIVWGGRRTLEQLAPKPWLELVHDPLLDGALPSRLFWQNARLDRLAARECELLFVPGGHYTGRFAPFVTMSRNLLPFDLEAARPYGLSWMHLRVRMLRETQRRTLRRADGTIFLTHTAQRTVETQIGTLPGRTVVIPHGVSARFRQEPRRAPVVPSNEHPFRWLYVSIVDVYKHQDRVAEAVIALNDAGYPVQLELVGSAYGPALHRLERVLGRLDPAGEVVRYLGPLDYGELDAAYHRAHGAIFASSCENLPNILVESMAAGLPIACSRLSVMPEVLGDGGVYFDPRDSVSIATALRLLLEDGELQIRVARTAYDRAAARTWTECAAQTFRFLSGFRRTAA